MKIELYAKIDKIIRLINLSLLTVFLLIINSIIWNVANSMDDYVFDNVINQVFVWLFATLLLMVVLEIVRFLLFSNSAHSESGSNIKDNLNYYFNNIFIKDYKSRNGIYSVLKFVNVLLILCFMLVSVYAFSNSRIYALEKQHEIDIISAQAEALKYYKESYNCVPKN